MAASTCQITPIEPVAMRLNTLTIASTPGEEKKPIQTPLIRHMAALCTTISDNNKKAFRELLAAHPEALTSSHCYELPPLATRVIDTGCIDWITAELQADPSILATTHTAPANATISSTVRGLCKGRTAVHVSAMWGKIGRLDPYLKQLPGLLLVRDVDGKTPLDLLQTVEQRKTYRGLAGLA